MSLRSIFRSSRLAGRNLRYIIFRNNNFVFRRSSWRESGPAKQAGVLVQAVRTFCAPVGPGSGAGRGGGAGGSIRESGGSLGKFGAANEEGYFYGKQKEQLQQLKDKLRKEPKEDQELGQKPEKP